MIEMTCPQCKAELEIDEGFRGGVCRCSHCGKLLAVPSDPHREQAESLHRPDTPDAADRGDPSDTTTYRTTSGRTVELSEGELSNLPIAYAPRMSVRIGVMAVVGVVMLALFGGVIFGMVMLISGPAEVDPDQAHRDIFQIDENPFLKAEPSFMGLPVGSRTVFMIDSSAAMRDYLGPIKRAAVRGVETLRGDQRVQIAFWNEGGPIVYPQEPTPAGEIDEEAMVERLEGVYASGGLSPRPAFLKAMEGEPDRIILVARVLPEELALKSIRQQVREGRVHFTVVLIDSPADPLLKEIAEDSGGTVIELPGGRVQRWYEAYLDGVERGS